MTPEAENYDETVKMISEVTASNGIHYPIESSFFLYFLILTNLVQSLTNTVNRSLQEWKKMVPRQLDSQCAG